MSKNTIKGQRPSSHSRQGAESAPMPTPTEFRQIIILLIAVQDAEIPERVAGSEVGPPITLMLPVHTQLLLCKPPQKEICFVQRKA